MRESSSELNAPVAIFAQNLDWEVPHGYSKLHVYKSSLFSSEAIYIKEFPGQ